MNQDFTPYVPPSEGIRKEAQIAALQRRRDALTAAIEALEHLEEVYKGQKPPAALDEALERVRLTVQRSRHWGRKCREANAPPAN